MFQIFYQLFLILSLQKYIKRQTICQRTDNMSFHRSASLWNDRLSMWQNLKSSCKLRFPHSVVVGKLFIPIPAFIERRPATFRMVQFLWNLIKSWKGDPLEARKLHQIWTYQTRFYWACSWAVIINATLLTPSSRSLNITVYSKQHIMSSLIPKDQKIMSALCWCTGRLLGPPQGTKQ